MFYVSAKNDLKSDSTAYTLWVYSTDELRSFLTTDGSQNPIFNTSITSAGSDTKIESVKWSPDGNAIFFILRETGKTTLMQWSTESGKRIQFMTFDTGISGYEYFGAESLAVFVPQSSGNLFGEEANSTEPIAIESHSLPAIFDASNLPQSLKPHKIIVANWKRNTRPRSYEAVVLPPPLGDFSPSPDGRHVAVTEQLQAEWTGRCWRDLYVDVANKAESRVFGVQISVLDLETGETVRPFAAPIPFLQITGAPRSNIAVWSTDGTQAITASSFAEEDRCDPDNLKIQRRPATYVFSTDGTKTKVYDASFNKFGEFSYGVESVQWGRSENIVIVEFDAHQGPYSRRPGVLDYSDRVIVFEFKDENWAETTEQAKKPNDLIAPTVRPIKLEVRQDYNVPPAVFVVDRVDNARMLHDLAPKFLLA